MAYPSIGGMLTSHTGKVSLSPESAPFLSRKERFCRDSLLFSIYLSGADFCIPLFVKKIQIFVRVFPLAPAIGWKYAILGMGEIQTVKMSTENVETVVQGFDMFPENWGQNDETKNSDKAKAMPEFLLVCATAMSINSSFYPPKLSNIRF